jgi:hypothetical protein
MQRWPRLSAWADQLIIPEIMLIVRSLLGDLDGAMEIAELLEAEGEAFSTELIFIPETLTGMNWTAPGTAIASIVRRTSRLELFVVIS